MDGTTGQFHLLDVPAWLNPVLRPTSDIIQDPCIFFGYIVDGPDCAVKIVRQGSEEAAIYHRLQREPRASSDHTLPCEIIGLGDEVEPLLVFPYLIDSSSAGAREWPLSKVLQLIHQILEVSPPCVRYDTILTDSVIGARISA